MSSGSARRTDVIHVRCGSDIVDKLAAGGVAGRAIVWSDPLCEGPVVAGGRAAVRAIRGPWIATRFGVDAGEVAAQLLQADQALEAAVTADEEVVLWFESDLYDQAILVHVLDLLAPRVAAGRTLTLVTLLEHPARPPGFVALGELSPAQLAVLFPARIPVTADMVALAQQATAAWCAPNPRLLEQLRRTANGALPYLGAAVERVLEEFPDRRSGLGRTERQALEAVAGGATTAGTAFIASQGKEERRWLGDGMFYARLGELSIGKAPLLQMEGEWPVATPGGGATHLFLTDQGTATLAGEPWTARTRPLWIGGTQVTASPSGWRWDSVRRDLVRVV